MLNTTSPATAELGALRPTERVQAFFEDYLAKNSSEGGRLPTIKEVSRHLDVSMFTVQSVVAQLAKDGRVVTTPGKGTFITASSEKPVSLTGAVITVSIHERELVGKGSAWGKEICAGVMHGLSEAAERMTIHPFFVDSLGQDPHRVRLETEEASAAIIFPGPHERVLTDAFATRGKPVINIIPPDPTTAHNFVSPDFFTIARRIGEAWLETSRQHVLFLSHQPLHRTSSSHSLAGLTGAFQPMGCGQNSTKLTYRVSTIGDKKKLKAILEELFQTKGTRPDAIYSTSDTIAADTLEILNDWKISIPEEVSIIGGTGLSASDSSSVSLTVVAQPLELTGSAAAKMVIAALRSNNQAQVGCYLETPIRIGQTTRKCENERLLSRSTTPR